MKKIIRRYVTPDGGFELRFNQKRKAWCFRRISDGFELPCHPGFTRQRIIDAYEGSFASPRVPRAI